MASKFVHLHVHSHYSLLSALPQLDDLVKQAKEYGLTTLTLTDNGNLYGAIEFYKQCKKNEIKPIIGIDAYMALRNRTDKQSGIDNRRTRLILLAKNADGFRNLIKIVTASHIDGFYYKPRIDRDLLKQYKDNLVCISPAMHSEISQAVKNQDIEKAEELIRWYQEHVGKENFFLEITHHPEVPGHPDLMQQIIALAKRTGAPIVAANEVFYLKPEDRRAREVLLSIQNTIDFSERSFDDIEEDFSFISPEKMEEHFKDMPEAIENSVKIADMCNLELELGKWKFPNYIVESGRTYDEELRYIVEHGIKKRSIEKTKEVIDRMEYELKVIKDKGYAPYFLVVADLLRFAHEQGILTTIRGSVAGSLVTYLAGITNVNPLEYLLPFERFLNPERPSAPDIDMDYADNRRDEVIEYTRQKYGYDKVAQIGTFGTMMARGAVRDTARALGYPYATADRIAKLIPMGLQGKPMTIDKALDQEPELMKMYQKETETREIIDMAKKIEGCARHISVHAAGVVISPIPLTDIVPLQLDTKGENKVITQYDMHAVDEDNAGLLKFDFLGIKNLSILADAVKLVKQIEGVTVDIENIPMDDAKTFKMLALGNTIGLFQLNGSGMTKALKELKPTVIHDINVMVALYRPGPMDNINEYIARKHGTKPITYMHPKMKNFLDKTFGVLVYQDDLLYTAIEVAGYTWGEVDKFRKAVGKKIPAEMAKQHVIFVEGCIKHGGMTKEKAEKIWDLFEPFQGYGFNKAHAASYGKVAYQTAYMKANFPAIYMSAVLTADAGDVEEVASIVAECKRMGIPVLSPDINESFGNFTVIKGEQDAIRFGLYSIKNCGEGIADTIIAERKKNGPFKTLVDFLTRIKDRNLNKKSLESLIKCGAMDELGERGQMIQNIEDLLKFNKESAGVENQDSLFGLMADTSTVPTLRMKACEPAHPGDKLAWEKELLGLYISGHPLDKHKEKLEKQNMTIRETKEMLREGMQAIAYGLLEEVKPINTKKGDKMVFLKIADYTGSIEAVAFPKTFKEYEKIFLLENCIAIKGRYSNRNGTPSILIEKAKAL
ncbi:DNA polymerase III subunit alpha [Candidatus Parcubacteria bacterium]|nr:DNA polymerase III subunit alpha [Candidatus Parcubacteria bacterium]